MENGFHIIAETRVVQNKDTEEILAYWVKHPRVIQYTNEDGKLSIGFVSHCPVSDEQEYAIASHHVTSILEPRDEVRSGYIAKVSPEEAYKQAIADEPEAVQADVEVVE